MKGILFFAPEAIGKVPAWGYPPQVGWVRRPGLAEGGTATPELAREPPPPPAPLSIKNGEGGAKKFFRNTRHITRVKQLSPSHSPLQYSGEGPGVRRFFLALDWTECAG
jgi:hypothetical protein